MQCDIFRVISSVTTEMNLIRMNSKRRYLLFWNVMQHWFVVSYCCFRHTVRPDFRGQAVLDCLLFICWWWYQEVVLKCQYLTTSYTA